MTTTTSSLPQPVHDAVITVPAYFDNKQKKATEKAGRMAGLNVLRLITEPAAAAVAYGLHKDNQQKNVFVFDLGGGTLDISILKVKKNKYTVVATNGDTQLGGIDFDDKLLDFCLKDVEKKYAPKFRIWKKYVANNRVVHKLRDACERAKKLLSTRMEVIILN